MTAPEAISTSKTDDLIRQLKLLVQEPESFGFDDSQRVELLRLSRSASRALETPQETTQRIIFSVRSYLSTNPGRAICYWLHMLTCATASPASYYSS
jgi:hypothetical protein